MRHLGSIVLGLLLAPVIWALAGIGAVKFAEPSRDLDPELFTMVVGLGVLAAAGLAYALLFLPRLSPLGPVLAGLPLLVASLWGALASGSFVDIVPGDVFGIQDAAYRPVEFAPLLAVPLLLTILSPRRWRGHDGPGPGAMPAYPVFPTRPDQPPAGQYYPPPSWPPRDTADTREL